MRLLRSFNLVPGAIQKQLTSDWVMLKTYNTVALVFAVAAAAVIRHIERSSAGGKGSLINAFPRTLSRATAAGNGDSGASGSE